MLNFLWDLHQSSRIGTSEEAITRLQHKLDRVSGEGAREGEARLASLERQIDTLVLTNMALWEVLKKKLGVRDEELTDVITEIDMRDGVLDGRVTPLAKLCSQCDRPIAPKRDKCLYCGGAPKPGSP